tara:strand:+ start:3181 stop:3426 length:246 start_codon:yes stop_codon:yes gene_type:complete
MKKNKIYAVLDEDRGADTYVYLFRNYKSAKQCFNRCVENWKECLTSRELNDIECWDLQKDHLKYDITDHWGNVRIIKEGES